MEGSVSNTDWRGVRSVLTPSGLDEWKGSNPITTPGGSGRYTSISRLVNAGASPSNLPLSTNHLGCVPLRVRHLAIIRQGPGTFRAHKKAPLRGRWWLFFRQIENINNIYQEIDF